MGSILGSDRPKSLSLEVVASPMALRIMGIALRLARQCQANVLVKYWLKNGQETWVFELSPLTEILLIRRVKTPYKQATARVDI